MSPDRRHSSANIGSIRGAAVEAHTLRNAHGVEATVLTYGAILATVITPDSSGNRADITLGFDVIDIDAWGQNPAYFGATVGRFANRIAGGAFQLDGVDYELAKNNEPAGVPCALHGGLEGFDKRHFAAEAFLGDDHSGVRFKMTSPAGDQGYPGELTTVITYTLRDDNTLTWHAEATTDAPTVINLVNHTYWNLSGDLGSLITDHVAQIHATQYLQTNAGLIPQGPPRPVEYTPLDFTEPTVIGDSIDAPFQPLDYGKGYDHAYLLDSGGQMRTAAIVFDPKSGRSLEVATDQPALHFYTGNWIDDALPGKNGAVYQERCGFCLETENWPDAPNNPDAPSPILRPGETYTHTMTCKFGW